MNKLSFSLLTALLFLAGCANFDTSNLQSAKPLPAGERRLSWQVAPALSYARMIPLLNDSGEALFEGDDYYYVTVDNRPEFTVGLGRGMELSGAFSFYMGTEYNIAQIGSHLKHDTPAAMLKLQAKKSFPIGERYHLAIAPTYTANNGVFTPRRSACKFAAKGWEIPVIYTKVIPNAEGNHSHSFTMRYAEAVIKSEVKYIPAIYDGSDMSIYKQPDHTMYRAALIYTFGYEKAKKRRFFDAGLELVIVAGRGQVMPIFGINWDIAGMKETPWK